MTQIKRLTLSIIRMMPLIFACCVGVIALMSIIPSTKLPNALDFWDKAQHVLAFATLTLTGCIAYPNRRVNVYIGLILFAISIELIQKYFTMTHVGDRFDLLADSVGAILGTIIYLLFNQWIKKIEKRTQ